MTIEEMGKAYHEKGCNCCQSVLCTLGSYTGLDERTAIAQAVGFGGGMLTGNVCGAVTGGMMAIGLACTPGIDPAGEKERGRGLCEMLQKRFEERFGTLLCADIIREHEHELCDACIAFAAKAAEDIIKDNKCNQEE